MTLKLDPYNSILTDWIANDWIGNGDAANVQGPPSWSSPWDIVDSGWRGHTTTTTFQPTPTTSPALYEGPGGLADISVADIHQGQISDCFVLSPIGEIALWNPQFISNMIHANGNGTDTVTLYTTSSGQLPTPNDFSTAIFRPVSVTVADTFPSYAVNGGASPDTVNGIWPQVLESAVATLNGGYGGIAYGGSPVISLEELTGQTANFLKPAALPVATLASALQSDAAAHDLIVMDTPATAGLPFNLVSDHAYMFDKLNGSGASATVQLLNPWGFNQPAPIPLSQLSAGIVEVDIGHFA